MEPSFAAWSYAKEKYRVNIFNAAGDFTELGLKQRFDAICLWHVLEHLPDLHGFLRSVGEKLKKDGLVFLGVPNLKSFTNSIYGAESPLLREVDHLYHFSPGNLRILLDNYFEVLCLFSREEDSRLKSDLAALAQIDPAARETDAVKLLAIKARLERDYCGHELFCIARKKTA